MKSRNLSSYRNLSFRQLYYFVTVAECGKVSEAAKIIARSQSAVTASIRELEAELEVALFQRLPSGVVLTAAGQELLPHAYGILRKVDAAWSAVKIGKGDITGSVKVGAKDVLAAYYLPAPLTRFRQACPHIMVNLEEMPRATVEQSVADESIDIGIVPLLSATLHETVVPDGLCREVLEHIPMHLWVGEGHPFLARESVSAAEIAEQPYVLWAREDTEASMVASFAALNLAPREVFRVSSIEAVRSLVANGAGMTILPDLLYRTRSLDGARVERLNAVELFPGTSAICLLWKQHREANPAALRLRHFLQKRILWSSAPIAYANAYAS